MVGGSNNDKLLFAYIVSSDSFDVGNKHGKSYITQSQFEKIQEILNNG